MIMQVKKKEILEYTPYAYTNLWFWILFCTSSQSSRKSSLLCSLNQRLDWVN